MARLREFVAALYSTSVHQGAEDVMRLELVGSDQPALLVARGCTAARRRRHRLPRAKYLRECLAFTVGRATPNFWPSTLPYTKREEQAIARLRRDERNKHVTVVRLVIPGSVEIGVQRVAQAKLADIVAVLKGHASKHGGGLSREDVDAIFEPLARLSPVSLVTSAAVG